MAGIPASVPCSTSLVEGSTRMGMHTSSRAGMKRLERQGSRWNSAGVSGPFWCLRKQVQPTCACPLKVIAELREGGHGVTEGDVVEYPLPAERRTKGLNKGVGVVAELHPTTAHVEPLVQEEGGWIYDEMQQALVVPVGEVRVLQTWYSERMVPDRISNPHGEHAESFWVIEDPLSPDCGSSSSLSDVE